MAYKVQFSAEAVRDGYWEIFHDDDCGVTMDGPDGRICPKCKFFVDLQSLGARPTAKNELIVPHDYSLDKSSAGGES